MGVLGRPLGSDGVLRHGRRGTSMYSSWHAMHARCRFPSATHYRLYGGRGITVCERWNDFANFLADMGERPPGMSIDRIDNDGNYEPSNCRWATASEQQRNKGTWRGTHCKRGHEFAVGGEYALTNGGRQCRQCALDRARARSKTLSTARQ